MQSIRVVWRYLEYSPIDGFCLRQTPGLMVLQRGLDGLGDRGIHGVRACRLNFLKRPATLLVSHAAATGARIVTADLFHNRLLSHLFFSCNRLATFPGRQLRGCGQTEEHRTEERQATGNEAWRVVWRGRTDR